MVHWKITRRRRLTLLKIFLIGLAILGVIFWLNQVRDIHLDKRTYHQGKLPILNFAKTFDSITIKNGKSEFSGVGRGYFQNYSSNDSDVLKNALVQLPKPLIDRQTEKLPAISRKESKTDNSNNYISPEKHQDLHISPKETRNSKASVIKGSSKVIPGLGENGKPVYLSPEEQKLADEKFSIAAFNVYVSDLIALNRTVPDPRNPNCKYSHYNNDLPTASVIIIFTNEVLSALLRTVISVVNRSPHNFLHEIILVDDYSDKDYLKDQLDTYIQQHFPSHLVKVIRLSERRGLVRARLAGAKLATGDVLVFLDSHCEANVQWLEPLLQRIKENRKAVLCPIIDVIDDKTLEYYASNLDYFQIGGFTWNGHFTWIEIPEWEEKRKANPISPTRTPTMAGGLFAIERYFFWEIGSYDTGMDIWGGENLEMSFRVWMCGGILEIVPCSHVGHIFRSFHPYSFPGNKDTHGINTVRTVEVWMDDYKEYFYMHRPDLKGIDYGDISERLNLKEKLQCKSFDWYLNNIYPQKFILDRNVIAYGSVRNPISNLCLDILNRDEDEVEPIGLFTCSNDDELTMNQMLSFTLEGELRREENCAETSNERSSHKPFQVLMAKCHGNKGNQEWNHKKGGPIIHLKTGRCLDAAKRKSGDNAYLNKCHGGHSQIWWFENYVDIQLDIKAEN